MHILIWSELFWPYVGGAEVAMAALGPALRARGHEISVITSHDQMSLPDRDEFRGMAIHRFPMRAALREGDPAALIGLRRQVAETRRQLATEVTLLSGVDATALLELQTREACPAPLLSRLNHVPLARRGQRGTLLGRVLEASDAVVSVSARVLEETCELFPSIRERSSVLYTGCPEPDLAPAALPWDPPRLLCLGRLVPNKGIDRALDSLAELAPSQPALRLQIAGDGPERPALEARAAERGIAERVDFEGWIEPSAVAARLNRASLLVIPSRDEGLPNVAIQAAWMGRPIVCSDAGGLPEVVLDGETGLVVPSGDGEALTRALQRLLADPESAAEMGRAARHHAAHRFGWERCVDAFEARLQGLRDRGPHSHRPPVTGR